MPDTHLGKLGRSALWFSPIVIVGGGFLAALYWIKPKSVPLVLALTAACSIFVMGYASFLARRVQKRLDEVQIASQGFAHFRGWVWGMGVTVLLLLLPPMSNWLIDLANTLSTRSPDESDRGAVHLGLFLGFLLLVLMQTLCSIVAAVAWWRRMERP